MYNKCNVAVFCLKNLDLEIDDFKNEFETDAVLFMNYDTEGILEELGEVDKDFYKDDEGCAGRYKGCKIFYNSELKFGEVEVR